MAPPRRRPSSSEPASRPRRLAGQGGLPPPPGTGPQVEPMPEQPEPEPEPEHVVEPEVVDEPEPVVEPEPDRGLGGLLTSRRTTVVLIAVIALLAVASLAGGGYLLLRDDRPAGGGSSATAPNGDAQLTISGDDARVAVAAAAQAAYTIVATSYRDYDQQVEEAAALMTTTFAEEYRQTAADVRDDLVKAKTEVQVSVVAQGAVSANDTEVRALVFLNQFVTKNGKDPVYTPYRALVTVVRSEDGWLVAGLDTA